MFFLPNIFILFFISLTFLNHSVLTMLSRKLLWKTTINYSKMRIKTNSFSTMATVTLIATGVPTFLYVYKVYI